MKWALLTAVAQASTDSVFSLIDYAENPETPDDSPEPLLIIQPSPTMYTFDASDPNIAYGHFVSLDLPKLRRSPSSDDFYPPPVALDQKRNEAMTDLKQLMRRTNTGR